MTLKINYVFLGYGNFVSLLDKMSSRNGHFNLIVTEQNLNSRTLLKNTIVINRRNFINLNITAKNLINSLNNFEILEENNFAILKYIKSRNILFDNIINLGSSAVYKHSSYPTIESDNVFEFHNKILFEKIFSSIANIKECRILNLRISNIYGNYMKDSLIYKILNNYRLSKPITIFSDLNIQRDYILDSDVAKIILKLIDVSETPKILNISSSRGMSFKEIINIFKKTEKTLYLEFKETPLNFRKVSILNNNSLRQTMKINLSYLKDYLEHSLLQKY